MRYPHSSMNPTLWGPVMWQVLFSAAWHMKHPDRYRMLISELIPRLLPCHECRLNFRRHRPKADRRTRVKCENAKTSLQAIRWLYHLKGEVIASTGADRRPHLSFQNLHQRMKISNEEALDDLVVANLMVFVALEAHAMDRDDDFYAMCDCLAILLPFTPHSPMPLLLQGAHEGDVCTFALHCLNQVRSCRGMKPQTLKWFEQMAA